MHLVSPSWWIEISNKVQILGTPGDSIRIQFFLRQVSIRRGGNYIITKLIVPVTRRKITLRRTEGPNADQGILPLFSLFLIKSWTLNYEDWVSDTRK